MRPAIACVALTWLWMALTVHFNYQDNWTALFCIGDRFPTPNLVRAEHPYVFANSPGYDGQFYHDIAHDPMLTHDTARFIDAPRLRERRILVPAMAWLLALGSRPWIDTAYFTLMLAFVGAGSYWLARYAVEQLHLSEWMGLLYLAVPSTIIAIDRMTTDLALTSLFMGFVYYFKPSRLTTLWIIAAAACLTRETGLCIVIGYCLYLAWNREYTRSAIFSTSALPWVAWSLYVANHIPRGAEPSLNTYPFSAFIEGFRHHQTYPVFSPIINALDIAALIAFLTALILVFRKRDLIYLTAPFVALALAVGSLPGEYVDVYGYARPFSPILLVVLLDSLARRSSIGFAALAIISARASLLIVWQSWHIIDK